MKFDGKVLAAHLEEQLKERVGELRSKLRAVSLVVGEDPASIRYAELKKAAAERVGVEFEVQQLGDAQELVRELERAGRHQGVDGVMVQLPVPGLAGIELERVLAMIPLAKDMDGLRWEKSGVMPATVRAVLTILEKMNLPELWQKKFVVVGARGAVGRALVVALKKRGVEVVELDLGDSLERVSEAEVVISCTGQAGLITPELVQSGAVVVDVGAPKGDMTKEVYEKASIYVPSPGGVGPVTISSLLFNLVECYARKNNLSASSPVS